MHLNCLALHMLNSLEKTKSKRFGLKSPNGACGEVTSEGKRKQTSYIVQAVVAFGKVRTSSFASRTISTRVIDDVSDHFGQCNILGDCVIQVRH